MIEASLLDIPSQLSLKDYEECRAYVIKFVEKKFPYSCLFELGGQNIIPGLSDLDFMIVSDSEINGNLLYRRTLKQKYVLNGIIDHEFFAINKSHFCWLNRITSYKLRPLNPNAETHLSSAKFYEKRTIDYYFLLGLYCICNYPMNFIAHNKDVIHVKYQFSKLKKLLNYGNLLNKVDPSFSLSENFKAELFNLSEKISTKSYEGLNFQFDSLFSLARKELINAFESLDNFCHSLFPVQNGNGFLEVNGNILRFNDKWKKNLVNIDGSYNIPKGLVHFNQVFKQISEKFLSEIKFNGEFEINPDLIQVSNILNEILNYSENSSLSQLIFDINFSIKGHDSIFYKAMSIPRKLKSWYSIKKKPT